MGDPVEEKRGLAQAKHSGDMPVGLLKKPLWVEQTDKKRDCTEGGRMGAGLSPFCPISLKWRAKTTGTGNSFTSKPPKLSQSRVFAFPPLSLPSGV
jgi:hypothetical protein